MTEQLKNYLNKTKIKLIGEVYQEIVVFFQENNIFNKEKMKVIYRYINMTDTLNIYIK